MPFVPTGPVSSTTQVTPFQPYFVARFDDSSIWQGAPKPFLYSSFITVNVLREPLIIPREPDYAFWQWGTTPQASELIIQLIKTKFFGAGGQAVTHNYNAQYTWDEAAPWYAKPLPIPFRNFVNPFFYMTLAFANRYAQKLTYDDPAFWQGAPDASWVIPTLTNKTFYGQGGQVPTKNYNSQYTWDEAAPWYAAPLKISELIFNVTPPPKVALYYLRQMLWTYDDAAVNPTADRPRNSEIMRFLTKQTFYAAGGQGPTKQWHYDWDEAAVDPGKPLGSLIMRVLTKQTFYGQGGQVPAKQWRYDWDEAAPWYAAPEPIPELIFGITPTPFSTPWLFKQTYTIDDATVWNARPTRSTLLEPILNKKPFHVEWSYRTTHDDPAPFVSPARQRGFLLIPQVQTTVIQYWGFNYIAEEELWRPWNNRNIINDVNEPFVNNWKVQYTSLYDEQIWYPKPRYAFMLPSLLGTGKRQPLYIVNSGGGGVSYWKDKDPGQETDNG